MAYRLHLGDGLEHMRNLAPGSVDAVIVDLPYYGVVDHEWDNQWASRANYVAWVMELAREWKRITKSNSSIFIFCDEKMEAYLQVELDKLFLLLNKVVWFKPNNLPQKNAHLLRSFAPMTERALFYTTQYDSTGWESVKLDVNNFVPLREYFSEFKKSLGMSEKELREKLGHGGAIHCFRMNSNWDMPTPETYQELLALNPNHGFLPRSYEALRAEYEALRAEYEALRRPFNADAKTWDVIEWPIVGAKESGKHPTRKPLGLIRRIVSVITNPGQTVLDCCMGSGVTGVACMELGRDFIGVEKSPEYFETARADIEQAAAQPLLI